jgi:hypothetical protein
MKEVKCFWCKEKGSTDLMEVEEKGTGKFNKNGTEKKVRKYFHTDKCNEAYQQDKLFKEQEFAELDVLYQYLVKLHGIEMLDGRMIEKLQDLRNGSVKLNNKKIKQSKQGYPYSIIYETYKSCTSNIDFALKSVPFKAKWNEFSYIFAIVSRNINDINLSLKKKEQQESLDESKKQSSIKNITEDIQIENKLKKRDAMDISDFL